MANAVKPFYWFMKLKCKPEQHAKLSKDTDWSETRSYCGWWCSPAQCYLCV